MSWKAFDRNCLKCRALPLLRAGKIPFGKRPCPLSKKTGKQVSPSYVQERMHKDWECPERR